jgi:hypothetical protein
LFFFFIRWPNTSSFASSSTVFGGFRSGSGSTSRSAGFWFGFIRHLRWCYILCTTKYINWIIQKLRTVVYNLTRLNSSRATMPPAIWARM